MYLSKFFSYLSETNQEDRTVLSFFSFLIYLLYFYLFHQFPLITFLAVENCDELLVKNLKLGTAFNQNICILNLISLILCIYLDALYRSLSDKA